jgi:DMSO/TMAO reductase YedYZ molybdopterin-dependent catalytic subunit
MTDLMSRRRLIGGLAASGSWLAACGRIDHQAPVPQLLDAADGFTLHAQRLLIANRPLVRELSPAQISSSFPTNGTTLPKADYYKRLLDTQFRDWSLRVHGLVERPLGLSLAQLQALPSRTQITLHQCDEGWSAIGQWTGVPLAQVLALSGLAKSARYVVFHCLDKIDLDGNYYYESLDLFDALHPQTILAYGMNGKPLPVGNGAPLRLRVETQIGYKNAKYVDRIEVVNSLQSIGKGRGGWWEDFDHAVWYAGQ